MSCRSRKASSLPLFRMDLLPLRQLYVFKGLKGLYNVRVRKICLMDQKA